MTDLTVKAPRQTSRKTRRLTGWHVLAMFIVLYVVIISVNLTMATKAVSTFPGLEVKNSYVASQSFDARRAAQAGLGWQVAVTQTDTGLRFDLRDASGVPVVPVSVQATLARPTHRMDDQALVLEPVLGGYTAQADLGPGRWQVLFDATAADGTVFHQRVTLMSKAPRG